MQKIIFIRFVQFLNLQKHIIYLCFFLLVFLVTISSYSQVGIGTINPDGSSALDITSTNKGILIPRISLANVSTTMLDGTNTAATGLLIFNTNAATVGGSGVGYYYFNSITWERLTTSATGDQANTLDEAYDEGGAGAGKIITATDGAVTIAGEDGLLVTGTFGSGDAGPSGAGTKMFFNPNTASFRAGYVDGTQWDNTSIGFFSVAMGENSIASGNRSTALGGGIATAYNSIAMGFHTTASGLYSLAFGINTTASGKYSTAMGRYTVAKSYGETTLGVFSTDYTPNSDIAWNASDRLFVIGNGQDISNKSNALTIYKNGLLNINDAYNMPLADGTANQVMQTDGSGNVTWIDASGFEDHDFYKEGTSTSPDAITDDIFTQGNMAIGKNTADYSLDIESSGTRGINTLMNGDDDSKIYGQYIKNENTGSGTHYGNYISLSGSGSGKQFGIYQSISNTVGINSERVGVYNVVAGGGSGDRVGTRNKIIVGGADDMIGTENILEEGIGTGNRIGTKNYINRDGGNTPDYGVYNELTGWGGEGKQYGTYNKIINTHDNEHFGTYNYLAGVGIGNKYGSYTTIGNSVGGTHYGVYSDVLKSGSYAGYFLGNVSIGTTTSNNYLLPASRGALNQVMQTDGSGNVTWVTPTNGDVTSIIAGTGLTGGGTSGDITINAVATNGLTTSANDIILGGSLTQVTTITQGTNNFIYNLNSTGDFRVQDAGTNVFEISDSGVAYFGDDTYWRDANTGGTDIATLTDDGNDGRFRIFENGVASVDLDANTGFIFNEQGLDRDFKVESDDDENILFVNAGTDRVGIGTNSPVSKFHVSGGRVEITDNTDATGTAGTGVLEIGNSLRIDTNEIITNDDTLLHLQFGNNGDLRVDTSTLVVDSSTDRVGIKTTAPSVALDVIGSIEYTGTITDVSDARLKENIKPINNALERVLKIDGFTYNMIDDDLKKREYGVIAQDVQEVFPEIVSQINNDNDYLGVSYVQFVPILIEALKEQNVEIQKLEDKLLQQEEIEELKLKNQKLEDRLSKIEAMLSN